MDSGVVGGDELRVLGVAGLVNGGEIVDNATTSGIDLHTTVSGKVSHEIRGVAIEHDKHASMEINETAELLQAQGVVLLVRLQNDDDIVEQILSISRDLELVFHVDNRESATLRYNDERKMRA